MFIFMFIFIYTHTHTLHKHTDQFVSGGNRISSLTSFGSPPRRVDGKQFNSQELAPKRPTTGSRGRVQTAPSLPGTVPAAHGSGAVGPLGARAKTAARPSSKGAVIRMKSAPRCLGCSWATDGHGVILFLMEVASVVKGQNCCRGEHPEWTKMSWDTHRSWKGLVSIQSWIPRSCAVQQPQHLHPRNLQWHSEANCSCGWEGQGERNERNERNEGQRDQRGPSQIAGHGRLRRQGVPWGFPRFPTFSSAMLISKWPILAKIFQGFLKVGQDPQQKHWRFQLSSSPTHHPPVLLARRCHVAPAEHFQGETKTWGAGDGWETSKGRGWHCCPLAPRVTRLGWYGDLWTEIPTQWPYSLPQMGIY